METIVETVSLILTEGNFDTLAFETQFCLLYSVAINQTFHFQNDFKRVFIFYSDDST